MQFLLSSLLSRVILGCALVLAVCEVAVAKGAFSIKPAPQWVRKIVPSTDSTAIASGSSSTRVLDDEQIKVSGNSAERYYHYVRRINNSSGLDDLSQLRFEYEPSYQQLTIHFIRIQRGSQSIDALRPSEIKTVQQEEELDQQLYNGTMAAVVFVNDLRVGDVVDYAYSINGENPVLEGLFADSLNLATFEPIQELAQRLVYPTNRPLVIKKVNTDIEPTKQTLGEDTEYFWYRKNVAAVDGNDYTPSWFDPYPSVTLSEFQDWAAVVNWALPFYQIPVLTNPELRTKVEQWKKSFAAPDQRAVAALRFVQDEIRYLGIELGRYSHQPTAPDKVFARRFGDCKDKSLLLSSILKAMDIEAYPVLINTIARSTLDTWQPSPFAFDHVIVRADINGKTYWFDPTMNYQRGGLNTYYDPPFERALVLRSGESTLANIPRPTGTSGSTSVLEIYEYDQTSQQVSFSVLTTYMGSDADRIRYLFSNNSPEELGKMYLNYYADTNPSIKIGSPPRVDDNQEINAIVLNEQYLIDDFWKGGFHRFYADKILAELDKPSVSQRTMPLRVRYPLSLEQTILVRLGEKFEAPVYSDLVSDNAMRFECRTSNSSGEVRLNFSLKTFTDSVPVAEVANHLANLDKAQSLAVFDLTNSKQGFATVRPARTNTVVVWIFVILAIAGLGVLSFWATRRRTPSRLREFGQKLESVPGGTPEHAIRVAANEQVESTLNDYRCRCGYRAYKPESPPRRERFMYDGKRVLGVCLVCSACGQAGDLYFSFPGDVEPASDPSVS